MPAHTTIKIYNLQSMKRNYLFLSILFICLLSTRVQGQISTTISGGSSAAGAYSSFTAAITALNGSTITAPVTVDVSAGQTETLTGKITLTATGTSANPIVIQRNGVGANPKLIAYTGTVATPSSIADGFMVLAGCDYVTIDGLDLQESATNTTTTTVMDFGYGLFKTSGTNGCQYNTIQNCTITLNRILTSGWTAPGHQGSTGITVLNALNTATGVVAVTSPAGSNSYNKFYSNTIQNCNCGITINGRQSTAIVAPYKFDLGGTGDTGNDIGGLSASTGNNILNFGGATGSTVAASGIWCGDQWDLNIQYNTINNNNGGGVNHPSTLRGILLGNPVAPAAPAANITVSNNIITVKSAATTSQITGIESTLGANASGYTNTMNFNNNTITTEYTTATTGVSYGIYQNTSIPNNLNMNGNNVTITSAGSGAINAIWNSTAVTGTLNMNNNAVSVNGNMTSATINCVYNSGAITGTGNLNNNQMSGFNFTNAASSLGFRGVYNAGGTSAATVNVNGNNLQNMTYAGTNTGFFSYASQNAATAVSNVNNNTVTNLTIPCSGAVRIIDANAAIVNSTVSGNYNIGNLTNNFATTSASAFQLIFNNSTTATSGTFNVFNNNFSNVTTNRSTASLYSTSGMYGICWITATGPTQNIYNNTFTNITNSGAGYNTAICVGAGTTNNIYGNTVSGINGVGNVYGILAGTSTTLNTNCYGNVLNDLASSGSGTTTSIGITIGNGSAVGPTGTVNIYNNKMCSISVAGTTAWAEGMHIFKGATTNIYNNLIGGITAANSGFATAVNGINIVNSAADVIRIYYNTIYLTGTGATNFGSSCIFTTTAPILDVRNNILCNLTVPSGTGLAVGHRRATAGAPTTYAATSNNNMWYCGTPGPSNVIYYDGTTSTETLVDYQTYVNPRDGGSFSFDVTTNLLSTTCGTTNYLHIDPSISTQLESSASTITTPAITTDYDGDTRSGSPDCGADEFNGSSPAPAIVFGSMVPGPATLCVSTPRDIYVDVTTPGGFISIVQINYAFNGVAQPPVIMNNIGGDTYYGQIPTATPTSATVTWSIQATNSMPLTTSYSGTSYYDDLLSTLSVTASASSNPICAGIQTVLTASVSYPGGTKILGAGATTSATYSNPFYSLWSNTHNQHLLLASELSALGLYAGNITSLGLNITSAGTLPMIDFSLKMGLTSATNMSSYVSTTMTTLYTNASYLPVAGVNTMTFTTPFYWDGVSNIVIEICHGNSASTATMSRTCQADNTAFVSSIHTHKTTGTAGSSQCTDNTSNVITYSLRPRFYITANIATTNVNWNDGLNNVGNTASITVNPLINTTYTASMEALGCSVSTAPVSIIVNPVPASPTATNSTQCGTGIPTASVSSNAGAQGNGQFFWYNSATGGTLVQGPPMSSTLGSYYFNDFSLTTLTNSSIDGNASILSGYLQLTPNLTSQAGAITVNAPGTYSPTMLQVDFDETNSPAGLADGFSYSFSNDGSATGTTPTSAELGTGSKLRVGFDTYGTGTGAAGIYLFYGSNVINSPGQTVGTNGILAYSSNITWVNASNVHVTITVDASGLCNVTVGGTPIFTNVQLPASYTSANKSSWTHIVKARTGGIAGSFIIDNLDIKTNFPIGGSTTFLNPVSSTTTWYVSEGGTGGCNTLRTPVTVTVNTPPTLTVSNTSICTGQSGSLSVSSLNDPNYTYTWMPGNLTGATQTVTPSSTTTYTVSAMDNSAGPFSGCATTATQVITVNPLPTIYSVSATPNAVNPGCNTNVTLNAVTAYSLNSLLGNASSTTTTSTTAVTPYSSFYESGRIQYLITAAELMGLGFTQGNISSIGFDVTATSAFNQSGYTIKMAHTTATALSGYATTIGSFQTVYGPVTMTPPPLGVNNYTLSSAFLWNGSDNLLVEICHDNDNSGNTCGVCYGTSATVRYTATSFNSVYGTYNDNTTLCGTGVGTLTVNNTNRPNIYLNGNIGQTTTNVWDPGAMSDPAVVTPTTTTMYTVTCTLPTGCSSTATQTVTVNPSATLSGLALSYNTTDPAVTMAGTPSGGVFSGPGVSGNTFDPALAGVGTHTISYLPTGYCIPATVTVIVTPSSSILNLKCFIEGFYIGSGTMQPVLNNQGQGNPITECDSIKVELHDATSPYTTVHTYTGLLQTNGTLSCTFPAGAQGNSFYIVVNHRNAMQTWSATPQLMGATTNYDFSTAVNKAYGDNQVEVETGVFAFYSGDMNQDFSIDAFDYLIMDPDIYNGAGGWLATDLNGDGSVDAFDYLIYDPNGYNGITIQSP